MANQPAKRRKAPVKKAKAQAKSTSAIESPSPLIDAIPPEVHAKTMPNTAPATQNPTDSIVETTVPAVEKKPQKQAEAPKTAASTSAPASTPAPPPPPPTKKRGFFPVFLGGVVAAGLGYAAAVFPNITADRQTSEDVSTLSNGLTAVQEQVDSLAVAVSEPAPVDLSGIETRLDQIDNAIVDINARIDALPTATAETGGTQPFIDLDRPDLSEYQAEIDAMRADLEAQMAEMTQAAQTQLDAARAEAAAIEQNASAAAAQAAGRAALARVRTGLESGAPLGTALDDLAAAVADPLPQGLLDASEGIPTLASLQDSYAEVARAALGTARAEGVSGEETSGFGAFLRNQFDVRSVTPREGNDTDSILSRAEASVKAGRLTDALAELDTLPDVARAAMSDWIDRAALRASAVAAAETLATSLNDN